MSAVMSGSTDSWCVRGPILEKTCTSFAVTAIHGLAFARRGRHFGIGYQHRIVALRDLTRAEMAFAIPVACGHRFRLGAAEITGLPDNPVTAAASSQWPHPVSRLFRKPLTRTRPVTRGDQRTRPFGRAAAARRRRGNWAAGEGVQDQLAIS